MSLWFLIHSSMYELIERVDKDLTGWVSQDLTA